LLLRSKQTNGRNIMLENIGNTQRDDRFEKKYGFLLTTITIVLIAGLIATTMLTSPVYATEDGTPAAQSVAHAIMNGGSGNAWNTSDRYVTATASGDVVTVVTNTDEGHPDDKVIANAPALIINIPADVTVIWKARYINDSYQSLDDSSAAYRRNRHETWNAATAKEDRISGESNALITICGAGKFIVDRGAEIRVAPRIGSSDTALSAIYFDDYHGTPHTVNFEVRGGSVRAVGSFGHKNDTSAIRLRYGIRMELSGGEISATSIGEGTCVAIDAVNLSSKSHLNHLSSTINVSGDAVIKATSTSADTDICAGIYAENADNTNVSSEVSMKGGQVVVHSGSSTGSPVGITASGNSLTAGFIYVRGGDHPIGLKTTDSKRAWNEVGAKTTIVTVDRDGNTAGQTYRPTQYDTISEVHQNTL
jgi:hypothetical protein